MAFKFSVCIATMAMLLIISGCAVVYKDASGNPAPDRVNFECKSTCGYYDTRMNAIGTAVCIQDCMSSKGYPYSK